MTPATNMRAGEGNTVAGRALRRVGVIGDVHTEDKLLARAIERFRSESVDAMLCVGDITDGPNREPSVDRCCALLRDEAFITVCGNHDRWAADDEQRELTGATLRDDLAEPTLVYLNGLPASVPLITATGTALLCHGLEGNDMASVKPFDRGVALSNNSALQAMLTPRKYDFVINGHTHLRGVRTIDGLTLINAGTLHRDHDPGFVIIDFAARLVRCFNFTPDGEIATADDLQLP